LPSVPTSRATRVTSEANERSWSTIVLMVFFSSENLALHVHRDLARQVAPPHRLGHVGDVPHLRSEVAGHEVDRLGQVLPSARHAFHAAPDRRVSPRSRTSRATRGHFRSERGKLVPPSC
jgi:hypothetical protein